METIWSVFKSFIVERDLSIQWISLNDHYYMKARDGYFELSCVLYKNAEDQADIVDFETNYKPNGNKSPIAKVETQYEANDKTLKLARAKGIVDEDGRVELYLKVPGTFGSGQGRFVVGGYGIAEDYHKDDYVVVRVEDKDRLIGWVVAQYLNPSATEPVSDAFIQGMGVIPGIGEAFVNYPTIASYTDDEGAEENKGWYFWPNAQGNNLPAIGEVEVNPIGGYGFIPSGFYVKLTYQRPSGVTTGSFRANIDWGRKED